MKQAIAILGATVCIGTAFASPGAETMKFLSVPAVASVRSAQPEVQQVRSQNVMTVVFRQAAPCGQRPSDPWFERSGDTLHLGYRVAAPAADSRQPACVATGIFTIKGLPEQPYHVLAQSRDIAPQTTAQADAVKPSMRFMAAPAVRVAHVEAPTLLRQWSDGQLVVVARQPARCGLRASAPTYTLDGATLRVGFDVPAPPADLASGPCTATAIFTFRGLPARELRVLADARPVADVPPLAARDETPAMKFTSVPAIYEEGVGRAEQLQYRRGSDLVVILKRPSACGSRPTEPWMAMSADTVRVGYRATPRAGASDPGTCVATGIFTIQGVPSTVGTVASR